MVDVELERVRARLLEQPRVLEPSAGRHAVERGDHGHGDGLADATELLEVAVGAEGEGRRCRQVAQRLAERVAVRGETGRRRAPRRRSAPRRASA